MKELKVTLENYSRVKIEDPDGGFIENQSVTNVLLYLILKQLEDLNESRN